MDEERTEVVEDEEEVTELSPSIDEETEETEYSGNGIKAALVAGGCMGIILGAMYLASFGIAHKAKPLARKLKAKLEKRYPKLELIDGSNDDTTDESEDKVVEESDEN